MKAWRVRVRTFIVILIAASFVVPPPAPVYAWKPTTHVSLAELALQDALDDGMVTIYATDYESGRLFTTPSGGFLTIGEYPVDAQVLAALRNYPDQFRAGVLGPDAYPDIATGQQIIHPAGEDTCGQPQGVDINYGGSGTNPWLDYLRSRAFTGCNPDGTGCNWEDVTQPNQAFVLGYLAHAAGDMYGHTFINYYTGGPFHFDPLQENAIKHVVLEGYIDKRSPEPTYAASIGDGVDSFIYRNMVNASPNSYLIQNLLKGNNAKFSLPYVFSSLRANLQTDIQWYNDQVAEYERLYNGKINAANRCAWNDWTCSSVALRLEAGAIWLTRNAFIAANGLMMDYAAAWRDDIDSGLRAWPSTSHELAQALFFNPDGIDRVKAEKAMEDYTNQHLLSMAGLPDVVGGAFDLINRVVEATGIPAIQQTISDMKRDLLNYLLMSSNLMTIEQMEEYLKSPQWHFDQVLNDQAFNQEGTGNLVSLQAFNSQQLHINDPGYGNPTERYDYRTFPAAHNSVVMTKLILMSSEGINKLLKDLNPNTTKRLTASNAMLGFDKTLDGSNQWVVNPEKMVFADDSVAYRKIFMRQVGEVLESPCVVSPSDPPTPEPTPDPAMCLDECAFEFDSCMSEVGEPGGPLPRMCVQARRACIRSCSP